MNFGCKGEMLSLHCKVIDAEPAYVMRKVCIHNNDEVAGDEVQSVNISCSASHDEHLSCGYEGV